MDFSTCHYDERGLVHRIGPERVTRALRAYLLATFALLAPANASASHQNHDAFPGQPLQLDSPDTRSNSGASTQPGEAFTAMDPATPDTRCNRQTGQSSQTSGVTMEATLWWQVMAPASGGPITVSAKGSIFDTILVLYRETSPNSGSGTQFTCNDNISAEDGASELVFNSDPGIRYFVQLGGCATFTEPPACGESTGNVTIAAFDTPPNDNRSSSETPSVATVSRDTRGATLEQPSEVSACGGRPFGKTVWFRFVAPSPGRATFTSSGFDTVLTVYRGGSGTPLGCNDDISEIGASELGVDVTPGEYFIQIGGFGSGVAAEDGLVTYTVNFTEDIDVDNDGFNSAQRGGTDCDDNNASINPNATDVPYNNIDEDCRNGPSFDADDDGFARRPEGPDCDDNNRAINPNALEREGNFVDENCDGRAVPRLLQPFPTVRAPGQAFRRGTRLRLLEVRRVARGYRIVVRCRGRGCPRTQRRTARSSRPVRFGRYRNRFLRRGAVLEVFVTKPSRTQNLIGSYTRRTVLARRVQVREACLFPGVRRPRACPAS